MKSIIYPTPNLIIIDLVKEYGGPTSFTGNEHFAVVADSELTAEELAAVETYKPYVIITTAMFKAFTDNYCNDDRERKRDALFHEAEPLEASMLFLVDEFSSPVRIAESLETLSILEERMWALPDHQGARLYKKSVLGFSVKEIAEQEGVSVISVRECLRSARAAMKSTFVRLGVAAS